MLDHLCGFQPALELHHELDLLGSPNTIVAPAEAFAGQPSGSNTKEGQSSFAASEARARGAGAPAHLRRSGGQRVASSFRSARVALLNAGARAGWDRSFVRAAAANADVACAAAAFALLAYQVVRRPSANPPVATKVAAKWRSEHEQSLDLSLQRPSANSRPSQFAQGEGRSGVIPGALSRYPGHRIDPPPSGRGASTNGHLPSRKTPAAEADRPSSLPSLAGSCPRARLSSRRSLWASHVGYALAPVADGGEVRCARVRGMRARRRG